MLVLILYIVGFWIVLPAGLIVTSVILDQSIPYVFTDSRLIYSAGITIILLAAFLLIMAIIQFRQLGKTLPLSATPPKVLINRGLFALWRHPIYLFYTLLLVGVSLTIRSAGMLIIVLPLFICGQYIYIRIEEHFLFKRLGPTYAYYKRTTSLIFPKLSHLLKIPLWITFKLLFKFQITDIKNIPRQSPFFLMATHRNYFDPFFIGIPLDLPVNFVTTYEMYRKPLSRWLFRTLFCIPKKRYLNDSQAVRAIINVLNGGGIIGIFPEGERSWNGKTAPYKPEVLKLLKKFSHIPVLPVRIDGNYHAWPRWGTFPRRSKVSVTYQKPYFVSSEDSLKQIEKKLKSLVQPDDHDRVCLSNKIAWNLTHVIYRCPACRTFVQLEIINDTQLHCIICRKFYTILDNYNIRFTPDRLEITQTIEDIYENIRIKEEDVTKGREYNTRFKNIALMTQEQQLHYAQSATLYLEKNMKMHKTLDGTCMLTDQFIRFAGNNETFPINLSYIRSVTLEGSNKLQLYDGRKNTLYQIIFAEDSALKWQDFIDMTLKVVYHLSPNRQ